MSEVGRPAPSLGCLWARTVREDAPSQPCPPPIPRSVQCEARCGGRSPPAAPSTRGCLPAACTLVWPWEQLAMGALTRSPSGARQPTSSASPRRSQVLAPLSACASRCRSRAALGTEGAPSACRPAALQPVLGTLLIAPGPRAAGRRAARGPAPLEGGRPLTAARAFFEPNGGWRAGARGQCAARCAWCCSLLPAALSRPLRSRPLPPPAAAPAAARFDCCPGLGSGVRRPSGPRPHAASPCPCLCGGLGAR